MKREVYAERIQGRQRAIWDSFSVKLCREQTESLDMGLAAGGLMRQRIYEDIYGLEAWDLENSQQCFVHLANSVQYQQITGKTPPQQPPGTEDYSKAGLPWFDYYGEGKALPGSAELAELTSLGAKIIEKGQGTLPDNQSVHPRIVEISGQGRSVRDGEY